VNPSSPAGGPALARRLLLLAGVALAYLAAARFGLSLAFGTKQVTAVWPPTGLALAVLLAGGRGLWPGVALGAFAANALADEPLTAAAWIAAGNTLEAVVGAALLRRVEGFELSLGRAVDVLALALLGAGLSCAVSATLGVLALVAHGLVPAAAALPVWRVWWVGDALGDLVFAPFLLTALAGGRPGWRGRRLLELGVLLAGLAAASWLVFASELLGAAQGFQAEYAAFPFLIWAALRFGQREVAGASMLVSGVALWGALHQRGPFSAGTQDQRLLLLDVFIAVTSLTALLMGAVSSERRRSAEGLRAANEQLERRVEERTRALAQTNDQLVAANQVLAQRTRELATKNEEVEAFVYIVSHDLRAPLVNLMGFAKELDLACAQLGRELEGVPAGIRARVRPILEEDLPGALRFIRASATRFQKLIEALLALSRTGREPYRSEPIDMDRLVGGVVEASQIAIRAAGATVTVGPLPAATGDATALSQVFANLLGNALKYLQPGRPGLVEIGGRAEGAQVHYWVRDNGAGIPESARPRLFQVFQRFHPKLAEGEGMGLAIVKRVVERHGGAVTAQSAPGGGTTFHFSLPGAAAAPSAERSAG
jgi:signal transduction histidine kinase/uncharacterized MnhB-related membrane protein